MDAVKFVKEMMNICDMYRENCENCPLYMEDVCLRTYVNSSPYKTDEAVEIVDKYLKEHYQKTILDDFLEKYPDAYVDFDYVRGACPFALGYDEVKSCPFVDDIEMSCDRCWNRPLSEIIVKLL